ncbi:MAG: tRNA dihydrouridine synthase DusB [Stagnimonas sp.]|nr:tRNA dihydrouridine synthase DusB [Stagnimonas sp.]
MSLPAVFIGPHRIDPPLVLSPMAGVTDRPFRVLCRRLGAGLAVSEMALADPRFRDTEKSRTRRDHQGEPGPISVQLAGADPDLLAEGARWNVEQGAEIIDINMGCPAKKVCGALSGSALLRDEVLVARILDAVVRAVPVPVTLKFRTGFSHQQRNALRIACLAEDAGVAALALHGRTREDHYQGSAEYQTIADVKRAVRIPVFANGDVDSPEKARRVLAATGADGLFIGRAAQGNPWIFRETAHYLATGQTLPPPSAQEQGDTLLGHLDELYGLYGEGRGVRVARKHIQWYCESRPGVEAFWRRLCLLTEASEQRAAVAEFFAG